jgi:hypothetical protein
MANAREPIRTNSNKTAKTQSACPNKATQILLTNAYRKCRSRKCRGTRLLLTHHTVTRNTLHRPVFRTHRSRWHIEWERRHGWGRTLQRLFGTMGNEHRIAVTTHARHARHARSRKQSTSAARHQGEPPHRCRRRHHTRRHVPELQGTRDSLGYTCCSPPSSGKYSRSTAWKRVTRQPRAGAQQ